MRHFLRQTPYLPLIVFSLLQCWGIPAWSDSQADRFSKAIEDLEMVDFRALKLAIRDLTHSFPSDYPSGQTYLKKAEVFEQQLPKIRDGLRRHEQTALEQAQAVLSLQREALLANPLLDFEALLLIKRKPLDHARRATGDENNDKSLGRYLGIPQQSSWQLHTMNDTDGWKNEIAVLSLSGTQAGRLKTVFRPVQGRLINEMDLHFSGDKLMFSMPDDRKLWQIFELDLDSGTLRQVSPPDPIDVHNLDSCYLPNERIAFISTAPFQGVPCNPSVNVGMSYVMDRDGNNIRQICFEQDHNFCPTVMNDGRVLYLRWEYTDIPHVWARFLFTMNPDGTNQREFYGSGGYWPNAIFYARPIPNHATKFIGIVTGHHVGRVGELVLFDPALGRCSTEGVVQRIPGFQQPVEPIVEDKLTLDSWPKFLHPWPLSEKYFLVSCKPRPQDLWGIYLVDTFDNIVPIREAEGYALLEPIPLRPTKKPPVIADRVDLARKDALMYLENIYAGPGLEGVPPGTVKRLRLFTYQFGYRGVAGINHRVGTDGPWEPKRILGTVPVAEDGSAFFRVPANTPLSIQPVDAEGRALQLMRSWTTAMPGEIVSCIGCHEQQNTGPPNQQTIASRQIPDEIEPWYGTPRGFSFDREVQPVLDRYCVSCHNGKADEDGASPDLRQDQDTFITYKNGDPHGRVMAGVPREQLVQTYGGVFSPAYIALRGLIRVGGLESDLRLLTPGEFHANTCELVQMLQKGHRGVQLDAESWERLYAWIDLNGPCHGTWQDVVGSEKIRNDRQRRLQLRTAYGGDTEDPEVYPAARSRPLDPIHPPAPYKFTAAPVSCPDWPFSSGAAQQRQRDSRRRYRISEPDGALDLDWVHVPAGEFVMGDAAGHPDESPATVVRIAKPFWMSQFEITNDQFARFNPDHDSRFQDKGSWMFNEWDLGWPLNQSRQPVVRVSWQQAMAFCRWLSKQTGEHVTLPTEAQWEWACRAGSATPLSYGDLDCDFSSHANMADITMRDLVYDARDHCCPDIVPRDNRFDDGELVTAPVGRYGPNAWGLHDMHGNAWEWTRSTFATYPYQAHDGRNDLDETRSKIVRGGSWSDRPLRCRSAFRLGYPSWQKVYNVGFRVIIEAPESPKLAARTRRDR